MNQNTALTVELAVLLDEWVSHADDRDYTDGCELLGINEDDAWEQYPPEIVPALTRQISVRAETVQVCCVTSTCPGEFVRYARVRAGDVEIRWDSYDGAAGHFEELFMEVVTPAEADVLR